VSVFFDFGALMNFWWRVPGNHFIDLEGNSSSIKGKDLSDHIGREKQNDIGWLSDIIPD
jgi:nitrogen fixation-related uncharacterized protein